jgi:hypothetical protein
MSVLVSWRTFCVEALLRSGVERKVMKILAGVGSDLPENGKGRKGKVSLALYVNQGLVSTLVIS